jgi:hypothetical protein
LPQQRARRKPDGSGGSGWYPVLEDIYPALKQRISEVVLLAWEQHAQQAPPETGQTKVHKVERRDPREQRINELAEAFDERGPDSLEDIP